MKRKTFNEVPTDEPLPETWTWVSPDELADDEPYSIGIGPFGSNLLKSDYRASGVRLVFVKNIRSVDFSNATSRYVTPEKAAELHQHTISGGELLITKMGDPPGDVAIYPEDAGSAVITSDCIKLKVSPEISSEQFVEAAVRSLVVKRQVLNITTGVAHQKVSLDRFRQIAVPLPPLPEQRRIVAKLDRLSTRSAAARDHLARTTTLAARAKQAVLARMIDDLPGEREEIGNAVAHLDQGWSPKCEGRPAHDDVEWAVIKTTAIQAIVFDGAENKALPSPLEPRPALQIEPGDVLITRAGPRSRVGIACFVREARNRLMLCDKAYRLRTDPSRYSPAFLAYILNSPASLRQLEDLKTGISDSGLNLTQKRFLALRAPLPSLKTQEEIVRRIETTFERIDRITEEASRAAHLLDRLDERLLAKAFCGELVPQDPDDEPAEALLARIREARAAAPKPKRGRRKHSA